MDTGIRIKDNYSCPPVSTIIKAGLLAGTLDISLAFLYSYIKRGTIPETVLQYISKVALGKTTLVPQGVTSNPIILSITGLLIHFAIAMAWSIAFFVLYQKLKLAKQNKIVTGAAYGIFVWAMMNIIVLPIWNHQAFVFKAEPFLLNALILVLAIGLPLSFIAKREYLKKGKRNG